MTMTVNMHDIQEVQIKKVIYDGGAWIEIHFLDSKEDRQGSIHVWAEEWDKLKIPLLYMDGSISRVIDHTGEEK